VTHLIFEADGESFFGERDHGTARSRLFVEKTKSSEFSTSGMPYSRSLRAEKETAPGLDCDPPSSYALIRRH
jgi:hypothetical protein